MQIRELVQKNAVKNIYAEMMEVKTTLRERLDEKVMFNIMY